MPRRNHTPGHKPFHFAGSCHAKQRHPTKAAAEKAADNSMLANPHLTLAVYKCELCSRWHLTKRPDIT